MAKVYKVSLYITDYNDEYRDGEHLKSNLKEHIDDLWVGVNHLKIQESYEFEFDDELPINKINASEEDFEAYFTQGKEIE